MFGKNCCTTNAI